MMPEVPLCCWLDPCLRCAEDQGSDNVWYKLLLHGRQEVEKRENEFRVVPPPQLIISGNVFTGIPGNVLY
jgi:hypothetical protein